MKKYLIFWMFSIIFILSFGCTSLNKFFEESEKVDSKNIFSKILITDTSVNFPEYKKTGVVRGRLTNTSEKALDGNFKIVFYAANGGINKIYNTPIPGSGIKPGETKVFSVTIDKFDYETYDFKDDNVFVK